MDKMKDILSSDILFFFKTLATADRDTSDEELLASSIMKHRQLSRYAAMIDITKLEGQKQRLYLAPIQTALVRRYKEIESVIKMLSYHLQEANIPIVLLKSAALNGTIYKVERPRGSSDLDIHVEYRNLEAFYKILQIYAIKNKTEKQPFSDIYEDSWTLKNDNSFHFDVHFNLTNPLQYNMDSEFLLEYSNPHPRYSCNMIKTLSNEMLYIHLALHILKDGYIEHHSIYDIIALTKKVQIDYVLLSKLTKKTGTTKVVDFIAPLIESITSNSPRNLSLKNKLLIYIMKNQYKKAGFLRRIQQNLISVLTMESKRNYLRLVRTYIIMSIKKHRKRDF